MTTQTTVGVASRWSGLSIGLWIAQGLLAALYGMAGAMKATLPIPDLAAKGLVWAAHVPLGLVRFIGVSELAGAAGLILPAATGILPILTPAAAAGLTLVQVLAIPFHISRGELGNLPFNLTLMALSLFVLWGRGRAAPIRPRS
jgi:putative oxidoreductase